MSSGIYVERLRVVLVGTRNPLNIGAAARAMSNFGFVHLRVVNAYEVAFREARSAMRAASLLKRAQQFSTIAEAVADCSLIVGTAGRDSEAPGPVRRLEQGARLIRAQLANGPVALLFGSEKTGLSNEELSYCHWTMRIPTREEHVSMNLGQAVAVCLYELIRSGRAEPVRSAATCARAAEVDRLTEVLLDALRTSGYVKARTAASTEQKVRRLVRRLKLTPADAELLTGMLRQVCWKLHSAD